MANFEGKKTSNNVKNNDTMSDDEVVASCVPPRYLFFSVFLSLSLPCSGKGVFVHDMNAYTHTVSIYYGVPGSI